MSERADGSGLAALQLESVQRLTAAFSTSVTADQITGELVRHAGETVGARAWIVVVDESGQGLDTAAAEGYDPDVVDAHQHLSMDAPLPLAEVTRTGQPLWYPDAREAFAQWPDFDQIIGNAASVAYVPLEAGDQCLGAIGLCFWQYRALFTPDRNYLLALGRLGGQALYRAREYDSEHAIATALQRALLPELPNLATADVCARYHPASAGAQIGGDWYDVIPLPEGRIGVVVGDVAGHNIEAAAVMGQMRATLRALAVSEEDPGKVTTRLNAMARDLSGAVMTTLFYGVWDPAGTLDYVSAGHLSPLISTPSGVQALFDPPPSLPIGAYQDTTYSTARAELKPGEILVAYTDGLIERRTEPIDTGMVRLIQALESISYEGLGEICDDIRARLQAREQEDDTVLLALRPLARGAES